jgi:hypothetical protein
MKFIDVNHPCGVCMAVGSEGGVCKVVKVKKVVCAMR